MVATGCGAICSLIKDAFFFLIHPHLGLNPKQLSQREMSTSVSANILIKRQTRWRLDWLPQAPMFICLNNSLQTWELSKPSDRMTAFPNGHVRGFYCSKSASGTIFCCHSVPSQLEFSCMFLLGVAGHFFVFSLPSVKGQQDIMEKQKCHLLCPPVKLPVWDSGLASPHGNHFVWFPFWLSPKCRHNCHIEDWINTQTNMCMAADY